MNLLSVENLAKSYGERVLFDQISFGLEKGDKVALIAENGSGKTTLLNILAGKDTADSGRVVFRSNLRVGYLLQDPVFDPEKTIGDLVFSASNDMLSAIREYEEALEAQSNDFSPANQDRFEKASSQMDHLNAWDHERKLHEILSRFEINHPEQKIGKLSGGQLKRLALALVLLDEPDLIILDEPTNHLDLDMIEWLERYLQQSGLTMLMVTHDRYFLDRVCNRIMELSDKKVFVHQGNYSYYLLKKAEREEVEQIELEKNRQLLKKELDWMRRMPKARTTKSKSRIDAFYDLKDKTAGKGKQESLKLEVKMSRLGGKILELRNVSKRYKELTILDKFDYTFRKGERIGIVGKNGVGKSTFLNIITEREAPDSGKVVTGETVIYGYYTQQGLKLKEDMRVIDVVKNIAEYITLADGSSISASQFLQQFMFSPQVQYNFVSKLSGGERRRLYLLTVLVRNPNFLILDEPTNDLDILTLTKLEEFLSGYGGCLLIVSHDRYFLDKVVDQLFIFEGEGNIRGFTGNYTEYRDQLEAQEEEKRNSKEKPEKAVPNAETSNQESNKLSYKEKLEFEALEKEIPKLEKEKERLENEIGAPELSYETVHDLTEKIALLIAEIETKTIRWLELSEKE